MYFNLFVNKLNFAILLFCFFQNEIRPLAILRTLMTLMMVGFIGMKPAFTSSRAIPATDRMTMAMSNWFHLDVCLLLHFIHCCCGLFGFINNMFNECLMQHLIPTCPWGSGIFPNWWLWRLPQRWTPRWRNSWNISKQTVIPGHSKVYRFNLYDCKKYQICKIQSSSDVRMENGHSSETTQKMM